MNQNQSREFLIGYLKYKKFITSETEIPDISVKDCLLLYKIFVNCRLNQVSSCVVHNMSPKYQDVAKIIGLQSLKHEGLDNSGNNGNTVRHHILCEIVLLNHHDYCCRISHLCKGSAADNSKDMKARYAIEHSLEKEKVFSKFRNKIMSEYNSTRASSESLPPVPEEELKSIETIRIEMATYEREEAEL
jgi:hypothetical protein